MAKICLITTVHQATDIRIFEKEAKALLHAGYEVVVIGPYPSKRHFLDGITIRGIPKPANRFLRWLYGWKAMAMAAGEKADLYHFHDPELIILALLLQILTGKPVIYDVHEYYSLALLRKPWIPRSLRRPLSRLVEKVEKGTASFFAGIITVNDHMRGLFLSHNPRTEAIYNYPFIRDFATGPVPGPDSNDGTGVPSLLPAPGHEFKAGLEKAPVNGFPQTPALVEGKEGAAVILYLGGLSRDRGLATVLESLALLRGPQGKAQLWVAGEVNFSSLAPEYEEWWQEGVAIGMIRYLGKLPYREIPLLLQECQITWLPWRRTPNNERGIPTKLLEYMAAGKPVVASKFGFIAQIVSQAGCGLLVPAEDPQAHAQAIEYLLGHPDEAWKMGFRGQQAFLQQYNWEHQEARFLAFYRDVLAAGRKKG